MKITVKSERRLARAAGQSVRYVHALLTAPEAPRRPGRQAINVALVLDRSGSMGGEKIALARQAVERALQMLHPDDRFALVVYDTVVDVLMESTPCTPDARREALRRLAEIDARGGTDLSSGWLSGCEQVARFLDSGAVGRCLLVTDGLANRGITDARSARPARARTPPARHRHVHLRRRRGLRRAPAPEDGGRRRRTLLLHRARGADYRPADQRARRGARGRVARGDGRRRGARRRPCRAVEPVADAGRIVTVWW